MTLNPDAADRVLDRSVASKPGYDDGIATIDSGNVHVEPEGKAIATMTGMRCGPFATLDEALAMIETHTRGVCRREPDEAQAASGEPVATVETSTDMSENASADPR